MNDYILYLIVRSGIKIRLFLTYAKLFMPTLFIYMPRHKKTKANGYLNLSFDMLIDGLLLSNKNKSYIKMGKSCYTKNMSKS